MNKPTAVVIGVGAVARARCRTVSLFAGERYHLIVAGRTPEKIAQVVQTIRKAGGSAEPMAVDTTREDDVVRLFDRAMSPG